MKTGTLVRGLLFLAWLTFQSLPAQNGSALLYDDSEVAEIHITIDTTALQWMMDHVDSDSLHVAQFRYLRDGVDETVDSIGFRLRGNTSRQSRKKSFKVSFNTFVPGRTFHGVRKLNLNGEHNDPSIIRSKLCWDLFARIGVKASRAAHVRLYINEIYYGLYISVEHIDETFLRRNFFDPSGNLWKCLWPADLTYLGDDPDLYKFTSNGRQAYDLKTNTTADDYTELAHLIRVLNLTPLSSLPDSLEPLLDVPGVLQYFAMNILLGSWDAYRYLRNNYYLYFEPATGRFHLIPYDYDNTFGVDFFGVDWATIDPYTYANMDGTPRPLGERLLAVNQYKALFSHFLDFYRTRVTDLPLWEAHIDSLKSLITPAAEADTFRTLDYGFTIEDFHQSYSAAGYSNQHVKTGLKEFVNLRNASLPAQLEFPVGPPLIYRSDYQTTAGDSFRVAAAVFAVNPLTEVTLQVQTETAVVLEIPMQYQPDPNPCRVERADRWQAAVSFAAGPRRYRIYARDQYGLHMTYPRQGWFSFSTLQEDAPVVINEFLARNASVNYDEAGEYDDWLELYNRSAGPVDLSGMYLSDDPTWLTKWQFPSGLQLEPNQFLLIWCDHDPDQGPLHASFRLDGDGEFLALVGSDGTSLWDSLSFGAQPTDTSRGRVPDGGESWRWLTPSPGAANASLGLSPDPLPERIYLSNYPNPFNGETTLSLSGSLQSGATLIILDMLGRQVYTFPYSVLSGGMTQLRWRGMSAAGRELPSGIYFAYLHSGETTVVTKLLLVK